MKRAAVPLPALGTTGDVLFFQGPDTLPRVLTANEQAVLDAYVQPLHAPVDPRIALIDSLDLADPVQFKADLKRVLGL